MPKNPFSKIASILLLAAIAFLAYILIPRSYDVLPHEKVADTQFWDLPTGSKIGYVRIAAKGSRKASPIIYLHGGPGGVISTSTISMLTPFAEEGYDVYAYDQIGSGSSARLEDIEQYTAARHQADLEAIVKAIGAERVIIIGQSWGSILATLFTVDNPNKVDKIIMTGPGPIFPINESLAHVKAPDSLHIQAPVFSNQDGNREVYTFRWKCVRWAASVWGKKLVPDGQADGFFTHLNSHLNRSALYDTSLVKAAHGGGGYYAHIRTMKSLYRIQSPREKMKALRTPVLILKGQYDNQKWGFTQEYLTLLSNASMSIIPDAGHFIHVEQPELYYEKIGAFLY
ncbi:MAG: alpha/beta fold hydrolase [Bacteroidia bacterium]